MEINQNLSNTSKPEQPKHTNTGVVIAVIVFLITLAAGGFLFLSKKDANKQSETTKGAARLSPQEQLTRAMEAAQNNPTVSNLINLGLAYFNNGKFTEAIAVNTRVLQMDSTNVLAYNNICAAYNNLCRYEEAMFFCTMALRYDAANELAKNNLTFSQKQAAGISELQKKMKEKAEKKDFIELGMYHYTRREFGQAITVYENGLKTTGDDALLLNNLCAAHCELKQWDKAIAFCQRALQLQPDFALAKNNLQWAKDGKAGKYD